MLTTQSRSASTPEKFNNATIPLDHFGKLGQGNHVIIVTSSFSKSFFFKFRPHENENPSILNSTGLKTISCSYCARSKVCLRFLVCFMYDITLCRQFATNYMKCIQRCMSTAIMDAKLFIFRPFSYHLMKQLRS